MCRLCGYRDDALITLKANAPSWNTRIKFGFVLGHINHSRLFDAKSSLYIYIKYI